MSFIISFIKKFTRYLHVGLYNTVSTWFFIYIFNNIFTNQLLGLKYFFAAMLTASVSFFLYKNFVFIENNPTDKNIFFHYALKEIILIFLTTFLFSVLVIFFNIIGSLIFILIFRIIINFIVLDKFIFK